MTLVADTFVYWGSYISAASLSSLAVAIQSLKVACRSVLQRRRKRRLMIKRKVWPGFWKPNTVVAFGLWWFDNIKWTRIPVLYGFIDGPLQPSPCDTCRQRCRSINVCAGVLPIRDVHTDAIVFYRVRLHHFPTRLLRLAHPSLLANRHIDIHEEH